MLKGVIKKLIEREDLSEAEIMNALNIIMDGNATPAQIASFLTALRMKGETVEEIAGCAKVMRLKCEKVIVDTEYCIDTCGTGGDETATFNISTAAAIVSSAGGVVVTKHGGRSVSSKCGSADVLEKLGVNIMLSPNRVKDCINKTGFGFLFAPNFHKSLKHAGPPRKEIGIRTIFNILGPLTNPANAKGQLIGVYSEKLTQVFANVLLNLNIKRALVVHGMDGMDEFTTTTGTFVAELIEKRVITYNVYPDTYGLKIAAPRDLLGGDADDNAEIILSIFKGKETYKKEIVVFNVAAALYVGKAVESIADGVNMAIYLIDSGKALNKLNEIIEFTNKA